MANEIETQGDYHWRNAMRDVRFFNIDARAAVFLLAFMLHMRLWTFVICLSFMTLFWFLERKGLTFSSALRAFRCWILGRKRPALLWTRRSTMKDYG